MPSPLFSQPCICLVSPLPCKLLAGGHFQTCTSECHPWPHRLPTKIKEMFKLHHLSPVSSLAPHPHPCTCILHASHLEPLEVPTQVTPRSHPPYLSPATFPVAVSFRAQPDATSSRKFPPPASGTGRLSCLVTGQKVLTPR